MRIEAPMAPAVLAAVLALIGGGGSIVVAQMPAHDCLRLASVKDDFACIESSVDVNRPNSLGGAPLHVAAAVHENPAVIKAPLDAGAS